MDYIHIKSRLFLKYMKQSFVPAWKLHQDKHSDVDEEVKQSQLVHLLSHSCFPALYDETNMKRFTCLTAFTC